ncbi:GNAT family acetyltransferase Nat4 [Tuber brumale]|nr:GNAT family acetyltransferase Nat4 [Tuber brumale]
MSLIETHNRLPLSTIREAYLPLTPRPPEPSHSITLETAKTLSTGAFKACFDLVRECKDMYKRTIGWSATAKKKEMKHPAMRYLILSAAGVVVGFLSFMITEEDECEVVYCYELHLAQEMRSRGLGRILVEVMEGFGKRVGVEKVMLTVFLENVDARRFYSRLGYVRDDFTPDDVVSRNGRVRKIGYEILSKGLKD